MGFYKKNIRPGLERLMAEASRKSKDIVFAQHRLE
jgi:DNA invertase Pin-like site-specific DNA recombinase